VKPDYYSPITIAILNKLCFFAIDGYWCCFRCGECHDDVPIVAAIAHVALRHPQAFPLSTIDLRRKSP
jgi:hypothetical protein